jgi:hypothetical protein
VLVTMGNFDVYNMHISFFFLLNKVYSSFDGDGFKYLHQDCAIAYSNDVQEDNSFGIIKFFLQKENTIYAVVKQLVFKRNLTSNQKLLSNLKNFYFIGNDIDKVIIIDIKQIRCKCTIILNNHENEFFISCSYDIDSHS